jgi:hypothetical protein
MKERLSQPGRKEVRTFIQFEVLTAVELHGVISQKVEPP